MEDQTIRVGDDVEVLRDGGGGVWGEVTSADGDFFAVSVDWGGTYTDGWFHISQLEKIR